MKSVQLLDNIVISVNSRKILQIILKENPILEKILRFSATDTEALNAVKNWIIPKLKKIQMLSNFI